MVDGQKEDKLEQTLTLSCYITEWMRTFKAYSVKQSTYDRLLTSAKFINLLKTVILILLILLMAAALIWFVPWIPKLNDPEQLHYFREKLDSFAPYSWLILFGVQLLQVFVAIIPGEPFELLAGVFCGTFGGLLLCLAGVLVGTVAIYYLVRWLGRSFIERMFEKEKVRNFKLLNNPRNLELLLFLLFFIPGTPKDLLTYMAPLTPVKPLHFFLIATLARIPSVFTLSVEISDSESMKTGLFFSSIFSVSRLFSTMLWLWPAQNILWASSLSAPCASTASLLTCCSRSLMHGGFRIWSKT